MLVCLEKNFVCKRIFDHIWHIVCFVDFMALSPTECTPITLQLCLSSRIGLWKKYYLCTTDINNTHYFSSVEGFTKILLFGLRDSQVWRRNTECQLCQNNGHHGKIFRCRTIIHQTALTYNNNNIII